MPAFGFGLLVSIILVLLVCSVLVAFWPVRLSVQGHRLRNDYKTGTMIAQLTAFIGGMLVIAGLIGIVLLERLPDYLWNSGGSWGSS